MLGRPTIIGLALVFLSMTAVSQVPPERMNTFEFQEKPPAVVVKDAAGARKHISLSAPMHLYSKLSAAGHSNHVLYILHAAPKKSTTAAISVVDLNTQRVRKVISVVGGAQMDLGTLGSDKVYVYSSSDRWTKPKPGQGTSITVIDTNRDQIIANYFWNGVFAEIVGVIHEPLDTLPPDAVPSIALSKARFFLSSQTSYDSWAKERTTNDVVVRGRLYKYKGGPKGWVMRVMKGQTIAMFTGTKAEPTWVSTTNLGVTATAPVFRLASLPCRGTPGGHHYL